jgi:predicted DNA-binding transcriptional regulator
METSYQMKHPPRNIVIDWLNTVWSTDLPANSKLVACNLRRYMNSQNDMAWPSVARIAGECGLSEQCVRKHLKILCADGWLQQAGKSKHETYIYQAQTPPAIIAPLQPFTPPPATIAPELNKELSNSIKGWSEWVDYRRELNKKMTPSTIKKQIKFLEKFTSNQQQAIIDQSIEKGWTGLFEIKENQNVRPTRQAIRTERAPEIRTVSLKDIN